MAGVNSGIVKATKIIAFSPFMPQVPLEPNTRIQEVRAFFGFEDNYKPTLVRLRLFHSWG